MQVAERARSWVPTDDPSLRGAARSQCRNKSTVESLLRAAAVFFFLFFFVFRRQPRNPHADRIEHRAAGRDHASPTPLRSTSPTAAFAFSGPHAHGSASPDGGEVVARPGIEIGQRVHRHDRAAQDVRTNPASPMPGPLRPRARCDSARSNLVTTWRGSNVYRAVEQPFASHN